MTIDIIRRLELLERRLRELESAHQAPFRIGGAGYRNSAYPIPSGTWTKVPLTSVWFDIYPSDGSQQFDATNGHFVIRKNGYYLLTAEVSFQTNATGGRYATITVNGNIYNALIMGSSAGATGADTRVTMSTIAYLVAGTTLELWAFQNSGSTLNVQYYPEPRHDGNQLCFWLLA